MGGGRDTVVFAHSWLDGHCDEFEIMIYCCPLVDLIEIYLQNIFATH
jgi:hypothetical protein